MKTLSVLFISLAVVAHGASPKLTSEPLSPAESLKKLHVAPGFKAELVAAEPMLLDPVAFDWDERGRLWVVEMADYPLGMDNQGKAGGRVRVLEDTDGDRRYDKSTLFANGLIFPNGLITWRDGVIVTAAPNILFLRDTNGDGRADEQTMLVSGLQEGNQQLRANGLRWGLDNWVYVAAGGHHGKYGVDTKLKPARTGEEVLVGSRDFRFRPDTGALEPQSGPTQFGRNRDNWGHWFGSQNSNPLWEYVLPDHYLHRNPHVGVAETRVQLLTPPNPPVFPASALEKRYHSFGESGRYTSACSGMVLRDAQLFPAAEVHAFVCEPFQNLVQHARLASSGVTFTANRVTGEEQFDFFASEDRWCRPVMVREGPDGALWIADMYRYMIEHPQWLPQFGKDELTPHYRSGDDRGRIYRVSRDGAAAFRAVRFDKMSTEEVVAALDTTNGWQRDKAQQVLLWRADKSAIAPLHALAEKSANPLARLHALCTLDGLGALSPAEVTRALADTTAGVRENALRLAETRFDPGVLAAAVRLVDDADAKVRLQLAFSLGATSDAQAGEALARLLKANAGDAMIVAAVMSSATPHLRALAKVGEPKEPLLNTALGLEDRDSLAALLGPELTSASLARLLDLLAQRRSSLDALRGSNADALATLLAKADAIFAQARATMNDANASPADRIAAASLLSRGTTIRADAIAALSAWLGPQHPSDVQASAVRALGETGAREVPAALAKAWPAFSPATREAAFGVWMSREPWAFEFVQRVERGELAASAVDTVQRARLLKHDTARVRQLASKLFSAGTSTARGKVVDDYRAALSMKGDAAKGREIYLRTCALCHKRGSDGKDIGPDLASVVEHPPEKLLTAILDPNADIQPGFNGYTCTLASGEQIYGLVASETANSVTMKLPDATLRTVLRAQIASLQSQNLSLMPEGLEAAITKEEMASLIEFLRTPIARGGTPDAAAPSWQERAAEHARILSQIKWTPVAGTMPNRKGGYFEAGKQYTGVPYSSVRSEGRYIGFDISLRTFLAAVENPLSVLYTENLRGKVDNAATFYGSVCSAYTSYALQCGMWEVSRRYGPAISDGIMLVDSQSAQAAQVGDVIYTPHEKETSGSHVEMVTAVTKDEQGRVVSVRVEESRPPTTATTDRSAANFNAHLATRNKQLFRITDLDAWRGVNRSEPLLFPNYDADAAPPKINRALLLDLGDWVPYQKGSAVKFHVMDRDKLGVKTLVIRRGGEVVEEIALDGPGVHERTFAACGDYTAHVVHRDGTLGQACEFAVCDLGLRLPAGKVPMAGGWKVGFNAENMKAIVVYLWNSADSYGRHPLFLTEEQRRTGSITIPAALLKKPGTLQVWLIGEHKLGRLKVRKDISITE